MGVYVHIGPFPAQKQVVFKLGILSSELGHIPRKHYINLTQFLLK